jgi:hypothetical protein
MRQAASRSSVFADSELKQVADGDIEGFLWFPSSMSFFSVSLMDSLCGLPESGQCCLCS